MTTPFNLTPSNKTTGVPSVYIAGTGSYYPAKTVTNHDLSLKVDTSDEWIVSRTGIRERRIAEEETTSDMAAKAGMEAILNAGLKPADIDLVIVATITPDMLFPSTACLVQHKLGIPRVAAFDIEAACSGFLYVLDIAQAMIRSGSARNALVIGSEKLSSILDWEDRSSCVLFGDGAGAVVLRKTDVPGTGILRSLLGSDGKEGYLLYMPGGGSARPASSETVLGREHYLKMNGREIFKQAVRVMEKAAADIMEQEGLTADQINWVLPHQANIRIIEMLSNRLNMPMEQFLVNLDRFGNTSAASIPIMLDEALRDGRIEKGDLILMVAFGAGLTWASSLVRWH